MTFPPSSASSALLLLLLVFLPRPISSLQCFECFDRLQSCTRSSNCTGSACVLFENMPNRTSVAFCLLATAEREDSQVVEGCWKDTETEGVECLCSRDFCNAPRDPWTADPNSAPVKGLKMLDKNPFVDYEYLEEEKGLGEGRRNGIAELDDPELPAQGEEQDLMPKDFEDYLDWERRTKDRNQTPKEEEEEDQQQQQQPNGTTTVDAEPASSPSSPFPSTPSSTFFPSPPGNQTALPLDNSAKLLRPSPTSLLLLLCPSLVFLLLLPLQLTIY